jgi:histidine triad (HIT) family protein
LHDTTIIPQPTEITQFISGQPLSLVQANGAIAGQSVKHLHVHVLPRREDDNLLINWSRRNEGDPSYIAELAGRIRAQL